MKKNTKNTKKQASSIPRIFAEKGRKKFTRDDIQDVIRWFIMADPQPGGRSLSKRERDQNAIHEQLAQCFDVDFDAGQCANELAYQSHGPVPMPVFRRGKIVLEGGEF